MAFVLKFITCLILTACIAASVDAAISCGTVTDSLAPCLSYLTQGGPAPPQPCCDGVKALNSAAQTTPDRQQVCRCLQSTAKSMSSLNPTLAAALPGKCGVNIGFTISPSIDCNNVK